MDVRRLGQSDLMVPPICLGTMTFGQQNTEAEGHAQLDFAFERGINFIDTAELYAVPPRAETHGASERIVGSWLAGKPRDQIVLATKVAGPGRNLPWIRGGPSGLDREHIRSALLASLERLRTDYVDLYQIHWPARNQPMFGRWQYDPAEERECTPIRDQLEALRELVDEGKIRHIGVSNEHPWGIAEFLRLAREHDLPRIASIQNPYNLLNRVYDYGLAEMCHRESVSLLAYSPLAFGHLTGKYLDRQDAEGRLNAFPGFGARYEKPAVGEAVRAYVALARQAGLSPTRMALSWAYHRWLMGSTIIGATSLAQLEENLAAWAQPLDGDLLAEIDAIHLRHPNPAP
ncbi:MAG: aldo/keto reductase [Rhodocyclaceae bacterium]|nr:aldo/keto reductase [Rhodocyclaceae bacterium]